MNKRVLILAYSFPPVASGRSLRALEFVKFLPGLGWHPYVITPRKHVVPEFDNELLSRVDQGLTVYLTANLEMQRVRDALGAAGTAGKTSRLKRFMNNIIIPDSRIAWLPFAIWRGFRVAKKEKPNALMVIAEPFSSLIAGVILKLITGLPLLSDFRDEWVAVLKYRNNGKSKFALKLEETMERWVIKISDAVTVTTDGVRDNFRLRYPGCRNKFFTVENGFDPDDYKGPGRDNKKCIMTYAGILYKTRFPKAFFDAFAELADEYPGVTQAADIRIIGSIDNYVRGFFAEYKYKKALTVTGHVPFKETSKHLKNSDLLFFQSETDIEIASRYIPAKLYEYIGSGKPIIAMGKNGMIKKLIEENKLGLYFDFDDKDGIKDALKAFIIEKKKFYPCSGTDIDKFTRRHSTMKLAGVLDSLIPAR